jgi:hypothetical protein
MPTRRKRPKIQWTVKARSPAHMRARLLGIHPRARARLTTSQYSSRSRIVLGKHQFSRTAPHVLHTNKRAVSQETAPSLLEFRLPVYFPLD